MGLGFARAASDPPTADVSVVIPVYNHDRFVRAAIESVLSQTVRPREILCIDDGSTDGSVQVLEAIAAQHPTVRFWSRPNQGAHRTINEGIREARGRYLTILNSDDLYHPARLLRCLAVLDGDPSMAAVATGISFVNEQTEEVRYPWYEEVYAFYEKIGDIGLGLVNGNFLMTTSNIVARRAVFDELGGFDDLRYAHDLDFFLRLLARGRRLVLLRQPLLTYRLHRRNTVSEDPLQMRLETAVVAAFFARRLEWSNGASTYGPRYLSRLLEVTDRQQLTRLVALSLLHAQREETVSPGALLVDPSFRSEAGREASAIEAEEESGKLGAAAGPPQSVSEEQLSVYNQITTTNPPIRQRLVDRILRRSLARRFFASVRWRSGLDADLEDLRSQLERVRNLVDASRGHVDAAGAKFDAELERISNTLGDQLSGLNSALSKLVTRAGEFESQLGAVEPRLAAVETLQANGDRAVQQTGQRLDELGTLLRDTSGSLGTRFSSLEQSTKSATVWADIVFRSTWSALTPVTNEPVVSVVLATRNRSTLLRRAVASVIAQSYPQWELVIVNDAGTDDTASVIEALGDHRIKVIDSDGGGAGRARNLGLRAASGSIIAFLDDDNLMTPGWLRAVVIALQERPELHAVYGAQLRACERRWPGDGSLLYVSPFDWSRLIQDNYIDLGVVAHRNVSNALSFDETLPRLIDWDYVVQLAGRFGIEALPVVASFYTTDAPMRLTYRGSYEDLATRLRQRFREAYSALPREEPVLAVDHGSQESTVPAAEPLRRSETA
jgi:glycosyltransferase involved in cell wall biosynthesis